MALKIKKTETSGLVTEYHRISNILVNHQLNQCIITLEHYVSSNQRAKLKEADTINSNINTLMTQIDSVKNPDIEKALQEKIVTTQLQNKDILNKDYIAFIDRISFNTIPEIETYSAYYDLLKTLDVYKDAEDI